MPEPTAARAPVGRFDRATRPKLELRGRAVRLEADPSKVWPRWMQIAGEGIYLGHPAGPFEFNEAVFDEMIANFQALPEYKPGATPVQGQPGVIAYDWRHASEQSALKGGADAMAAQGAKGWIWELEKRPTPSGGLGLFAFSDMLSPAREMIDAGEIAWTSVCVRPDTIDQITGKNIGCYLSSVALTNDPFVRGMVPISTPIAAERYVDFYEIPKTAGELVAALGALFGLDVMAPLALILSKLTELRACAAGQMQPPPGLDVVKMIGCLRRLFNLETIATPADVFARCDALLGAVAAEEALAEAAEPPSQKIPLTADRSARPKDTTTMDQTSLLALLAGHFKCSPTLDAIGAHAPIFFEKAAAAAKDGESAIMKLKAVCSAMGVKDPEEAINAYKAQAANVHAMELAFPELANAFNDQVKAEDVSAEEDVKLAASRAGMFADEKALFMMRTGGVDLAPLALTNGKIDLDGAAKHFEALAKRRAAGEAFRARLGGGQQRVAGGSPKRSALFERIAGDGNSEQRHRVAGHAGGDPNALVIDLSDAGGIVGENPHMRAMNFVRANPAQFGLPQSPSDDAVFEAGSELRDMWAESTGSMHAVNDRY